MALILTIDTALTQACISISSEGKVVAEEKNDSQYNHASFVQPSIKRMTEQLSVPLSALQAVAVVNGPGSYTGLRVGLASAKGICYALDKPLILINTLYLLATAAQSAVNGQLPAADSQSLLCPMIDARRMEVFTALYDSSLREIKSPSAEILDENYLSDLLKEHTIFFSGNGSVKFQQICNCPNAVFLQQGYSSANAAALAYQSYLKKEFADIAYCEPFYVKGFYTKKAI